MQGIRLTVLLIGTLVVVTEARTDGIGSIASMRMHNGAGTDSRWRLDLHVSGRVDDGGGVDGRHPDAHFVLLEQICDEFIEVNI